MQSNPPRGEVAEWLRLVFEPGDIVELRILNCVDDPTYPPFTVSGYFDHHHLDELAWIPTEEIPPNG